MKCYRIPNWNDRFESAASRKLTALSSVLMPTNHDGDSYCDLMERPDGAALYGAWCLIVQVAAKCSPRGTLVRANGIPHTAQSIARKTHCPVSIVESAMTVLSEIGWLTESAKRIDSSASPIDSSAKRIDSNTQQGSKEVKEVIKNYTDLAAGAAEPPDPKKSKTANSNSPTRPKPAAEAERQPDAKKPKTVAELARAIYDSYRSGYKVKAPICVARLVERFKDCPTDDDKRERFEALLDLTRQYLESPTGSGEFCSDSVTFFSSRIEEDDPESWQTDRSSRPKPKARPPPPPSPAETSVAAQFGVHQEPEVTYDVDQEERQPEPDPQPADPYAEILHGSGG